VKKYLIVFLLVALVFSAYAVRAEIKKDSPANLTQKDRIMGAIMGVLIGDALGVGCHWYYDLECQKEDFGWITDYVDPKMDSKCGRVTYGEQRIKEGLKKGGPSQTGQLIIMLLESVAEKGIFDRKDFTSRVDKLFETLDGTPYSGRYTDIAIRDTWRHRQDGIGWDDPNVGGDQVTSESAQMNTIIAALNYKDPVQLVKEAHRSHTVFYNNNFTATHSITYALVVGGLINGVPLSEIKSYSRLVDRAIHEQYGPFNDSRTQVETGAIAWDSEITFDPPHLISKVYGMHCEIQQMLPAAYYLIHHYADDFEKAVLAAINGGGNNMARAALTGGMSGAANGLKGIPERFIKGLEDHERLIKLAEKVAELAEK